MSNLLHPPDVLVLGAGPAGCAAAAVLAEAGRRVTLVDKAPRRRYSVGESMIPFCWNALDRLGLVEAMDRGGFSVQKNAVQFASIEGKVSRSFYFFEHTDHPRARTWQVVRSEFDALLRDNAVAKGALLLEETRVRSLLGSEERVEGAVVEAADGTQRELRAPVTIDATGRDALSQGQFGWRVPDAKLKKMAIWTYFKGAKRDPGVDEGTTTIAYLPEKGWFWYIPLPNDVVGVGVVADKDYLYRGTKDAGEILLREAQVQRWIADRISTGTVCDEYRVTAEFSYRSRHCATDGLVLAGDAFSFLDPVFSSGVYFALMSGVLAGDSVLAALAAGDTSAKRFATYGDEFRRQMEPMRRLVYAFYDDDFNFGDFLKSHPAHRADLTDCLIGDLDRDFESFFTAVSRFADLPDPLPHGGPRVAG